MKKAIQNSALLAYRIARKIGILSTPVGQRLSHHAYFMFKRLFEPNIVHLRSLVTPRSLVIDVGAHVGFYTRMFAAWVSDGGRVLAIEPAPANADALRDTVARWCPGQVDVLVAAASEVDGSLLLQLNPQSSADNRLAETGLPVRSVTIDGLLRDRGWPVVSFVKIDVQGAEPRVLAGAREMIARFHPAILIEIDDDALATTGSSAHELISNLNCAGYTMYGVEPSAQRVRMSTKEAECRRRELGYADFLFVWTPACQNVMSGLTQ